ncbi:MAG TPA: ribonuclease HII [Candidatus Paceibacterota bacterium]|nr:ribonuclease HII [Candidatus Paceibacterota bacterium]
MELVLPNDCDWVIGIDEAGRGPIAGPVTVAAAMCRASDYPKLTNGLPSFVVGKDSKKLTSKARAKIFGEISDSALVQTAVFSVSGQQIDKEGIVPSINSALYRCLKVLASDPTKTLVLLDGGLKAPAEFVVQRTIIKGDERVPLIGLASIVAKVTRDREMEMLGEAHPGYGFEQHKGYGTKGHYEALEKQGPTVIHRLSFLRGLGY